MSLPPDLVEMLSVFADCGVRYLVIGGHAVSLHSRPRSMKDLDLWLRSGAKRAVRAGCATHPEHPGGAGDDLLDASSGLVGEAYDPAKHPGEPEKEVIRLRLVGEDFASVDLVDRLAKHVLTYVEATHRLADEVISRPRDPDANRWARLRLVEVRDLLSKELEDAEGRVGWGPRGGGLGDWEGGRYLGVNQRKGDTTSDFWVCVMPGGEVVFAAYGPVKDDKARWKALMALAKSGPRQFKDGPGGTLLDASAVKALASDGDPHELRNQIMSLFRTFLAR